MNKKKQLLDIKNNLLKIAATATLSSVTLNYMSANVKAHDNKNETLISYKIETLDDEKDLEFDTYKEMCYFYSKVFELDENIIYNKINELINNEPYGWDYANVINDESYQTKEQAIARTIYDIYRNPENYGFNEDEIKSSNEYQLDNYLPEELVYKFGMVLDVNPYLAMSIAYCECGRKLDSSNFKNNHNIGGITGNNGYIKYKNEASGIFRFIIMLHDNYNVTLQSGKKKISSMSTTYCSLPEHWNSMVSSIYSELVNNGFDYSYKNNVDKYANLELAYYDESEEYIKILKK